jgi:hypothetical protein
MIITYRTTGAWGAGKGSNLTAAEVDASFYSLDQRVDAIETGGALVEPTNIDIVGSQITFYFSNDAEFTATLNIPRIAVVSTVAGTTFTPALADANRYLRCTNADGCAVTIPTDAAVPFPVDTELHFRQAAAGAVEIAGADGVTVNGVAGYLDQTEVQGDTITLKKVAEDEWDLFGSLLQAAP